MGCSLGVTLKKEEAFLQVRGYMKAEIASSADNQNYTMSKKRRSLRK